MLWPVLCAVLVASPSDCPTVEELATAERKARDANSSYEAVGRGKDLNGPDRDALYAKLIQAQRVRDAAGQAYKALKDRAGVCDEAKLAEQLQAEIRQDEEQFARQCPMPEEISARKEAADSAARWHSAPFAQRDELRKRSERETARYERIAAASERCRVREVRANNEQTRALDEKVRSSPKTMHAILSTNLCMERQAEEVALEAIKDEKANSKIAGVVSLALLREQQEKVVAARKQASVYRAALKALKLKPLDCDGKIVEALWSCANEPSRKDCADPVVQAMLRVRSALEPGEE